ncbi:MAG TPA: cytochrome P450 [Micromonosporaceae bacterium]
MTTTVSLAPLNTPEVRRNPYPFYAQLHEHGGVCAVESGSYQFVVHGYEAASQVLRDPTLRVVDESQLGGLPTFEAEPTQAIFLNSVMFNNEPRHGRMRKMFNQVFTARRVAGLDSAVIDIVDGLLQRMEKQGADGAPIDYMGMFAYPVPSNVMGELLGVPEEDRAWYRPLAGALGVVLEIGGRTPETVAAADAASRQLAVYFTDLAAKRRVDPRDDLITSLVQAIDAEKASLSPEELLANLVVLFNAGFVTTTHLIGNGLTLLLDHPDAMAALRAAPERSPAFIEEMLRVEVPTHFVIRWASADTEIDGVTIPKGSRILILLAAANRDPRRFPDPDRFDPSRTDFQALSFGAGAHFCLGAALARLEGQRAFEMLLNRFDEIALNREPPTPRQLMLRGYDELWITVS